jgi:hypothetical protein
VISVAHILESIDEHSSLHGLSTARGLLKEQLYPQSALVGQDPEYAFSIRVRS